MCSSDLAVADGLDAFFKHLRLRLDSFDPSGLHLTLLDALPGRRYRLEASWPSTSGVWTEVESKDASGGSVAFLDASGDSSGRLYRVVELP